MQDYDDIFEDPQLMAEAFQVAFFSQADAENEKECPHSDIKEWADGRGYCTACGVVFSDTTDTSSGLSDCKHEQSYKNDTGVMICGQCGKESDGLDFTQEWRYYGTADNRSSHDPSRCHSQKSNPKGIESVFEKLNINISPYMKSLVAAKYKKVLSVSESTITRGQGRISIVAASLFYAYQDIGEYRTSTYIRKIFGITQKNMSLGMTKYLEAFPEDAVKHITPEKLLPWLMKETGVDTTYYRRILAITRYISSTSELIERSTPQSITSSIIYFYLCLDTELRTKLNISKAEFAKRVSLTEITITKIVKEIALISREVISVL